MKHALIALAALVATPLAAQAPVPATAAPAGRFTLDTPIETIAADANGKAVLNSVFPEMLTHPEYENFKAMSLNQVEPLAGGAITPDMMTRAKAELAKLK